MSGACRLLWILIYFALFATVLIAGSGSSSESVPTTKINVVEETIHGHRISDPYRWLEDANRADTKQYVEQQLAYARSILDPLPGRDAIHQRLLELSSIGTISAPQMAGKYYFYSRRTGTQNQPVLLVREGIDGKDRPLVDVNQLATDGTVALDWWFPSEDGKYVAYGTSGSGSEESTLRIVETASGNLLRDNIDRTRFASVAWKKDNSGFYYTRRPKKGDVPRGEEAYHIKVFYHALGDDPMRDPLIFGEGRAAQDYPQVSLSDENDRWLLVNVAQGWARSELYLQDLKTGTPLMEITRGKEFLYSAEIFRDKLYITTNEGAPNSRVMVADATNPGREHWTELIPETDEVLQGVGVIGGKLFAQYEKNACSLIKIYEIDGKFFTDITLPAIGSVSGVGGRWDRQELLLGFHSFTVPPSVYRFDLVSKQTTLWDRVTAPGINPDDYEVKQLWYTSKDGTHVPMFVFNKKGLKRDGKIPTILTGYGGFNVSERPSFSAGRFEWLEHGGIVAVANLRGGSEFGEDWHRAGMLDKKQNVFDDFIAAAEFLISEKITDSNHLAITGGSNGGLLVGVALTQRPDLFRAVVCQVPLLDMLRYQNFQIAKLWIPEYGSADDPKQFDWLYAYSPYHHVKVGTTYPAILFMTGDTDTRVDPMHAKKMTALMQAQAANGHSKERPILLRIESKAGHGAGKPVTKQVEESTDVYSFLFWQLKFH
jgi:prolyl oligopeptidase